MKQLLDYDEDTGVAYYTEEDGGTISLRTEVDAEPMVEANKISRNEGRYDQGVDGMHKYCDIDDVLIATMLKKGINILNPTESDWKRFFQEIETNYPFYKVTNKKAWKPSTSKN